MAAKSEPRFKVVAENRKARFNYEIGEKFEAGIALTGSEVKSLRSGKADDRRILRRCARDGEIWLINCQHHRNICRPAASITRRSAPRKLLLHKRQINKLIGAVEREGMTLVPLKLYFNEQGPRQGRARARHAARRWGNRPAGV